MNSDWWMKQPVNAIGIESTNHNILAIKYVVWAPEVGSLASPMNKWQALPDPDKQVFSTHTSLVTVSSPRFDWPSPSPPQPLLLEKKNSYHCRRPPLLVKFLGGWGPVEARRRDNNPD